MTNMRTQVINMDVEGRLKLSPKEDMRYVLESVIYSAVGDESSNTGSADIDKNSVDDRTGVNQKTIEIVMEKSDVACEFYCTYRVGKGQTFNLTLDVSHVAPNTQSKILVKGVLDDGGVSSFKGSVKVRATAKGAKTGLEDRALVIGDSVYNHAEPTMQIETDDVEASHASTTGRVDEDQLFYLQSRGLSYKEAQDLLVNAFLEIPVGRGCNFYTSSKNSFVSYCN